MSEIKNICKQVPIIPVLVIDDISKAKPLAKTLIEAGLHVLEVTLRTPCALEVIKIMSEVEGSIVGAGTVLNKKDVINAKLAGAKFIVSPGFTQEIIDACEEENIPLLQKVSTDVEIMQIYGKGFDMLKFFPAEAAGGIPMLKALGAPFPNISFCPTGGISESLAYDYIDLPNVVCVGGSWITPNSLVKAENWEAIKAIALKAQQR